MQTACLRSGSVVRLAGGKQVGWVGFRREAFRSISRSDGSLLSTVHTDVNVTCGLATGRGVLQ